MVLPWTWLFLPTWWTIGWHSRCHGVLRYKLSSLLRYSAFYCLVGEVIVCWLYQSIVIYPLKFLFDCCGGYSLGYLEVFCSVPLPYWWFYALFASFDLLQNSSRLVFSIMWYELCSWMMCSLCIFILSSCVVCGELISWQSVNFFWLYLFLYIKYNCLFW